jgi:hypothetical protein
MTSVVVSPHSVLHITYERDKWTKPNVPGTKLMVFDNLKNAQCFRSGECIIYECDVKNPSHQPPKTFVDWTYVEFTNFHFNKLMQLKKNKKKHLDKLTQWRNASVFQPKIPYGTVFCDEIKLTNRVDF